MKKLLFAMLALSINAQADTYMTTTIASYHADREADYNEFNPGLGVKNDQWILGAYRNSHGNPSTYAGYEFRRGKYALQFGAITGYKDSQLSTPSHNGIYLYALPSIVIGDDVQYKFGVVPVDNWTLTFQIDWRI